MFCFASPHHIDINSGGVKVNAVPVRVRCAACGVVVSVGVVASVGMGVGVRARACKLLRTTRRSGILGQSAPFPQPVSLCT